MSKKTIAVIFDGDTKPSAAALLSALSSERYFVLPVFITNEGKWLFYDSLTDNITDSMWEKFGTNAILSPDKTHGGFLRLVGGKYKAIPCDVVFPLVNATQIAALCETAGIYCAVGHCGPCSVKSLKKQMATAAKHKGRLAACSIINGKELIICGEPDENIRALALKAHKAFGSPKTALLRFVASPPLGGDPGVVPPKGGTTQLHTFDTTPNFAPESDYAKLWRKHGFSIEQLAERLINE